MHTRRSGRNELVQFFEAKEMGFQCHCAVLATLFLDTWNLGWLVRRGILSVAWCQRDPDLLLSCGKDNRILCWNPNSSVPHGEVSENCLVGWGSAVLLFVGDGRISEIPNWDSHVILNTWYTPTEWINLALEMMFNYAYITARCNQLRNDVIINYTSCTAAKCNKLRNNALTNHYRGQLRVAQHIV